MKKQEGEEPDNSLCQGKIFQYIGFILCKDTRRNEFNIDFVGGLIHYSHDMVV